MPAVKKAEKKVPSKPKAASRVKPAGTPVVKDIHKQSAKEIYQEYRNPVVSPKGLGAAMKTLAAHAKSAGKDLDERHHASIKRALNLLHKENEAHKAKAAKASA